jgi:hypothetical protein
MGANTRDLVAQAPARGRSARSLCHPRYCPGTIESSRAKLERDSAAARLLMPGGDSLRVGECRV